MARGTHLIRTVYAVYAASLVAAGAVSVFLGLFVAAPPSVGDFLAAGWIFAGIGWVLGGYLLAPNVSTYMAPGRIPAHGGAPPFFWPSSAIPEASPQVLEDLGDKLSRGTDLGVMLAILGVLLLAAGALAGVDAWLGLFAGTAILVVVAVLISAAADRPATPGVR